MVILHYLSGLPPVRGGGMIKYALDLVEALNSTDDVVMLVPGSISIIKNRRKKVRIARNGCWNNIPLFRIINPLPIPMANGIKDIEWYTQGCDEQVYLDFLKKISADVIHVHTFMGLHAEFLSAARKMRIPVVYTTHDYFGICPKADLFCGNHVCDSPGLYCDNCCANAFGSKRILLEQSTLYRVYRNNNFLTRFAQKDFLKGKFNTLRSREPVALIALDREPLHPVSSDYDALLRYYRKMFDDVTFFHFNSSLTKRVYENHLGSISGRVIAVSTKALSDHRRKRCVGSIIRIGYFGGNTPYKGLGILQSAIDELWGEGVRNINLKVYGNSERKTYDFCSYYDAFESGDIEKIFDEIDILAVPSMWQETFGMVVPEAISYGIPVLATSNVGSAEYLSIDSLNIGIITDNSKDSIKKEIKNLAINPKLLSEMNGNILKANIVFDYSKHVTEMERLYEEARIINDQG